jgi:hypothetical protein
MQIGGRSHTKYKPNKKIEINKLTKNLAQFEIIPYLSKAQKRENKFFTCFGS